MYVCAEPTRGWVVTEIMTRLKYTTWVKHVSLSWTHSPQSVQTVSSSAPQSLGTRPGGGGAQGDSLRSGTSRLLWFRERKTRGPPFPRKKICLGTGSWKPGSKTRKKERNLARSPAPRAEKPREGLRKIEVGRGRSALHPPWGSRAQPPRFPIFQFPWVKKILPRPGRVLRNYLSGEREEKFWRGRRKGGKNSHAVTWAVFTHKRKVLSVSFQLSNDSQRPSEDAQELRTAPSSNWTGGTHTTQRLCRSRAPPAAEMLARALLLCAALALCGAGEWVLGRPAPGTPRLRTPGSSFRSDLSREL